MNTKELKNLEANEKVEHVSYLLKDVRAAVEVAIRKGVRWEHGDEIGFKFNAAENILHMLRNDLNNALSDYNKSPEKGNQTFNHFTKMHLNELLELNIEQYTESGWGYGERLNRIKQYIND